MMLLSMYVFTAEIHFQEIVGNGGMDREAKGWFFSQKFLNYS